jgi:hypothetical protein
VADALLHEKPQWVEKGLMHFHSLIEIPKAGNTAIPALPGSPTSKALPSLLSSTN